MSLELRASLSFYVQEEEVIIILELINEENFIQFCEHNCNVRAVLMSHSLSKRVMKYLCLEKNNPIVLSPHENFTTFLCG